MIVDSFANRLKEALRINNMKPVELSSKTGINKSLISNYLSGNFKARQDKLYDIAKALNVNEAWLMGFDVDMNRDETRDKNPDELKIDKARYIESNVKAVKIPVLGKVPAGVPIEAVEDIVGYEDITIDMLKGGDNYFALKIDGDSMYPDYQSGDIIIVKQQVDCESGDDCVVMVNDNDTTFKRVIKQDNGIILKPLNSNYDPYSFSNEDIEKKPVRILGKAVEVRRKLK